MRHHHWPSLRRAAWQLIALAALSAVFAGTVAAAAPSLTTDPATPDGSNGWFVTVPTMTIGPPLDGYYTLYRWLPAGPFTIYESPFKPPASAYGQPSVRFGYGLTPTAFDTYADAWFKIDPIAPQVTSISESNGMPSSQWHRSTEATFTWGSDEVHSGITGYSHAIAPTLAPLDTSVDTVVGAMTASGLYTGTWFFQVKALDGAGNWGPVAVREHRVDVTPPTAFDDAVTEYEGTAVISVSSADGHSGPGFIETDLDAGGFEELAQRTVTSTGPHELVYRATDAVGNVSATSSVTFDVVPNEAPTTTLVGVDDNWHNTDVTFELSATDNSSGVQRTYYSLDGAPPVEYSSAVTVTGVGAHALRYLSVDRAGNRETTKTASVKIDKQGPVLTVDLDAVVEGTATVNYAFFDALSGTPNAPTVLLDGVPWTAGSPVVVAEPGAHSVFVSVTDAAGNETFTVRNFDVYAMQPPVTTISGLPGTWQTEAVFELSAIDNHAGVASMRYSLDAGPAEEYFTPVTISDEGTTAIRYWSVDAQGNVEPANGPAYACVDRSGPVSVASLSRSTVGTASVSLSASDAYSGVDHIRYRLDAGPLTTYAAPIETSIKGLHVLEYASVDELGNEETTRTLVFSVGRLPTKVSARVSPARVGYGGSVTIYGVVNSSDAPVVASSNVSVWASVARGAWRKVGSAVYDSNSKTYRATRKVNANQRLQLRFSGDAENLPSSSAAVSVACSVYISRPITPWLNSVGRPIVVYGTLKPRHTVGTRVATLNCYRLEGQRWVFKKSVSARAYWAKTGTKYGTVVTLPARGRWKIVAVHADAAHAATASSPRVLLVR